MIRSIFFLSGSLFFLCSVIMAQSSDFATKVSISDAISIAKEQIPGRVVRAEWRRGFYEVRIKTDGGDNKTLFIDDENGGIVERDIISVDDAVSIATREVPGKAIKVEFEKEIYEVKIRSKDGDKVEVKVDPIDGKILKIKKRENHR